MWVQKVRIKAARVAIPGLRLLLPSKRFIATETLARPMRRKFEVEYTPITEFMLVLHE